MLLQPHRHGRARHSRHSAGVIGRADAAWSALTIGLAVIIVLVVLAIV